MSTLTKFNFNDVVDKKTVIDVLEVQSFEMNVYLVRLHVGNREGMLYAGQNLMRFHSTQQIRDAFEDIQVEKAIMVHESPYDEMIGNPVNDSNSLSIPFSMAQPY